MVSLHSSRNLRQCAMSHTFPLIRKFYLSVLLNTGSHSSPDPHTDCWFTVIFGPSFQRARIIKLISLLPEHWFLSLLSLNRRLCYEHQEKWEMWYFSWKRQHKGHIPNSSIFRWNVCMLFTGYWWLQRNVTCNYLEQTVCTELMDKESWDPDPQWTLRDLDLSGSRCCLFAADWHPRAPAMVPPAHLCHSTSGYANKTVLPCSSLWALRYFKVIREADPSHVFSPTNPWGSHLSHSTHITDH